MTRKTFQEVMACYPKAWIAEQLAAASPEKVRFVLQRVARQQSLAPEHLVTLLSDSARPFLEELARLSHQVTQQRFGKTIRLFVPLYLSNECWCHCTYCGYSRPNAIKRLTLNPAQVLEEGKYLHALGFRHLLLLSGEDTRFVNTETLKATAQLLRPLFSAMSIEVQPLQTQEYGELVAAGIDGVTVYQETYDREVYSQVHLGGRKKRYDYRLATPERAGAAGMRRIGIGALLGLTDWRYEGFYTALHAHYLEKHFWRSHISVSFPRLREATGKIDTFQEVGDREFVQMLCALRLFLPNAGFVLSTRESPSFRDHLLPLGVTQMSAGSRTTPGGYVEENGSGAQFEIADHRSAAEVAAMIEGQGYEAVWKDWDEQFIPQEAVS